MPRSNLGLLAGGLLSCALALAVGAGPAAAADTNPPNVTTIASTIPGNGDLNPYGLVDVPASVGALHSGNVLVSNFNDAANQQGTGTTIVQITPAGQVTTFATIDPAHLPGRCPGGVGLTTALSVLRSGWVIVGSLPTADGTSATAQAGCLLVLDSHGRVRETISGPRINGPWDMTVAEHDGYADLFVTNVLNGTVAAGGKVVHRGTVLRITLVVPRCGCGLPRPVHFTVIGSGFPERTDPAALVLGPTGVGLSPKGTLYVADTVGNRIAAIPDALTRENSAGTGTTAFSGHGLNGPLGLITTPAGIILTVNGGDGKLITISPTLKLLRTDQLDDTGNPPGAGALFGLSLALHHKLFFVDDNQNTLDLFDPKF